MGCSGVSLQFIQRPYVYERRPLKLGVSELIPFSGVLYSQPAYAALTDKRLFTTPVGHPVTTPILLYVNKGANVTIPIEPTLSASGYPSGCVNYIDYIEDIRDLLDSVYTLHATDSDHASGVFKVSHLRRNRSSYGDLNLTSASGVKDNSYVHPSPILVTPTGIELGSSGIFDIDVDEIAYQPIARPGKGANTLFQARKIPTYPYFPRVIKTGGSIPLFGPKDEETYSKLALNVAASGNKILAQGDRLLQDTSLKIMSGGSGSAVANTNSFNRHIDWTLYPAKQEMCTYIETSGISGITPTITASGRQSLYNVPSLSQGVYLTALSENTETSGLPIQHWPVNWESTNGLKVNGSGFHDGLYTENRLIYTLLEVAGNQAVRGRSIQNGRVVFAHFVSTEANSLGKGLTGGDLSFIYQNNVYSHAGKLSRKVIVVAGDPKLGTQITKEEHTESWAKSDKTLSPVTFETGRADDQGLGDQGLYTWHPGNNGGGGSFGVMLTYTGWGYIDYFVAANSPTSTPGPVLDFIVYVTRTYRETGRQTNGEIIWTEEPGSPTTVIRPILIYPSAWLMNNFFSFFMSRNGYKGAVNVNGDFYFQFGPQAGSIGRIGRLFAKPTAFNKVKFPAKARTVTVYSVGFFPSWKLIMLITTNNQVDINTDVNFAQQQILVDSTFTKFGNNDVLEYGPPVWDAVTGFNYLYVRLNKTIVTNSWFCKMNTSFKIVDANPVEEDDAIILGPIGIMDL